MPAPTFIGSYATAFNSTTSPASSAAFDVALGDVLVFPMVDEQFQTSENYTWGNSGTALTWTEQTQATSVNAADVFVQAAHATPPGTQTGITASLTRTTGASTHWFGGVVHRFSNATMTGVTAGARSTTPDAATAYTLNITTTLANSAIVYALGDFSAGDFSTRVHQTVNGFTPVAGGALETGYFRDAARYTLCMAYIPDAGAAGVKTIGMSGPATGDCLLVAVEVGGVAGAAAPFELLTPTPRYY